MPKVPRKKAANRADPLSSKTRGASTASEQVPIVTDDETDTQQLDEEEAQVPPTMTVKTSDRLSAKGEKATLKVVSWNINGIRAWLTNGGLKYIDEEQPDMICFQVENSFDRLRRHTLLAGNEMCKGENPQSRNTNGLHLVLARR